VVTIPASFRAFIAERSEDGRSVSRGPTVIRKTELPKGEVEVRVEWSSVNFKDALATIASGKVARQRRLVPGIDLAGEVVGSSDRSIPVGLRILAHGYDLGVARHGGYAEFARIPSGYVVPLPEGLTARDAMSIGTAGFTAAMSIIALEARGLVPADGPVLVTGGSGGVGGIALAILAERGYEVWASSGKPDEHDRLTALGAAGILGREEVTAESRRTLESERWVGAIDSVGGPTLPYILRTLRYGAAVASTGNAGGPAFSTTVFPFILRAASLLGIDSAAVPIEQRRGIWERLAGDLRPRSLGQAVTEVSLDELEPVLDTILEGGARGRWLVRLVGRPEPSTLADPAFANGEHRELSSG
jgi:putative YhdH/YhfP family quinone oxidoreductase